MKRKSQQRQKLFRGEYAKSLPSIRQVLEYALFHLREEQLAKAFRIPYDAAATMIQDSQDALDFDSTDLDDIQTLAAWAVLNDFRLPPKKKKNPNSVKEYDKRFDAWYKRVRQHFDKLRGELLPLPKTLTNEEGHDRAALAPLGIEQWDPFGIFDDGVSAAEAAKDLYRSLRAD